jgi:Cft2 family RNA processing exonuclease
MIGDKLTQVSENKTEIYRNTMMHKIYLKAYYSKINMSLNQLKPCTRVTSEPMMHREVQPLKKQSSLRH